MRIAIYQDDGQRGMLFLASPKNLPVEECDEAGSLVSNQQRTFTRQHLVEDGGDLVLSFEPRKKPSYFPLYWMVNRDPCNGLL